MDKKMYLLTGVLAMIIFIGAGCSDTKDTTDTSTEVSTPPPAEATVEEETDTQTTEVKVTEQTTTVPVEKEVVPVVQKPVEVTPAPVVETSPEPEPSPAPTITNCGADQNCLLKNIQSCTPATGDIQIFTAVYGVTITDSGSNCVIRHTAKSGLEGEFASWIGKHYDCSFTKAELLENPSLYDERALNDPTYCSGPYIDLMNEFTNQCSSGSSTSVETISVNVGVIRDDGKTLTITNIEGASGPATIQIDSESETLNVNQTKTINDYTITLLEILPQTCTINGVEKEGLECGQTNPYRGKIEIQKQ